MIFSSSDSVEWAERFRKRRFAKSVFFQNMFSFSPLFHLRHQLAPYLPIPLFARAHPNGLDLTHDLSEQGIQPQLIIDVGANVGQSAYEFHVRWPEAEIYCFEPVEESFAQLTENVGSHAHCIQRACGAEKGTRTIHVTPEDSGQSSLHHDRGREETAEQITLDRFANERDLSVIDLLKIDIEGHELRVLEGAKRLLKEGAVRSMVVEVGFSGDLHVPFEEIASVLRPWGFRLASFHDQRTDPETGKLRHANALWVQTESA